MKFGIRTPNIKSSIKARTTGRLKRAAKRAVNPMYGKKGMGWVNNPKKAAYNKVYNRTSVGVGDLARAATKSSKKAKSKGLDAHATDARGLVVTPPADDRPERATDERAYQFGKNLSLTGCLSIIVGPVMLGFAIYSVIGSWEPAYAVRRIGVAVVGTALLVYGVKKMRQTISIVRKIPPGTMHIQDEETE